MNKDIIFDGTKKSAVALLRKVFPKLKRYSITNLSNTCIGGLWDEKDKQSRIWVMVPSITALQTMRLAFYFKTEPSNIILAPSFDTSPNCDQCWWDIQITKPNSVKWEWKP